MVNSLTWIQTETLALNGIVMSYIIRKTGGGYKVYDRDTNKAIYKKPVSRDKINNHVKSLNCGIDESFGMLIDMIVEDLGVLKEYSTSFENEIQALYHKMGGTMTEEFLHKYLDLMRLYEIKPDYCMYPEGFAEYPSTSYRWASEFLKDRFHDGEKTILKSPRFSRMYSCFVLKDRWPDAEKTIKNDKSEWNSYCVAFNINNNENDILSKINNSIKNIASSAAAI